MLVLRLSVVAATSGVCQRPDPTLQLQRALRRDLVGCYVLATEAGRVLDRSFYNASPRVRLDSTAAWRADSTRIPVRILIRLDSTGHPMDGRRRSLLGPVWSVDSVADTLLLSFSDGLSGTSMSLAIPPESRDTLRGRIDENWDVGPPFTTSRGRGYAVRTTCNDH